MTIVLLAAVGIGFLQIADGIILLRNNGVIDVRARVFVRIQIVWLLTLAVLRMKYLVPESAVLVTITFALYMLMSFFYGHWLLRRMEEDKKRIPKHLIVVGIVFGAYYAITNITLYLTA